MFGDQLGLAFVAGSALVLGGLVLAMKSRNETNSGRSSGGF